MRSGLPRTDNPHGRTGPTRMHQCLGTVCRPGQGVACRAGKSRRGRSSPRTGATVSVGQLRDALQESAIAACRAARRLVLTRTVHRSSPRRIRRVVRTSREEWPIVADAYIADSPSRKRWIGWSDRNRIGDCPARFTRGGQETHAGGRSQGRGIDPSCATRRICWANWKAVGPPSSMLAPD